MTQRRGHNEGTITQRPDGLWQARVSLGFRIDAEGNQQRIRKSYYGKTRKEAAEKMKAAIRAYEQGLPVQLERQNVAQYLNRWLEDSVKPSVRPRTYVSYSQLVRLHLIPALGHYQLDKLAPQHIQKMMNDKLDSGLSPRTVQYLRAVIRRALAQAMKWGLVGRNVATLVDPPRSVKHENIYLDPIQAKTLLKVITGEQLEALYKVSLMLGVRQGEALGLRWEDIDFEYRTLTVRKTPQRIGGTLILTEPKTTKSRRTVPLPETVLTVLREHRNRQRLAQLRAGGRWRNANDLVFTTSIGTPIDARNVVRAFKAVLESAGLPDMRWHDLRHSCASFLHAQGADAREIMETLGHSQISLTMNTYTHVFSDLQRRTADRMDEMFGS